LSLVGREQNKGNADTYSRTPCLAVEHDPCAMMLVTSDSDLGERERHTLLDSGNNSILRASNSRTIILLGVVSPNLSGDSYLGRWNWFRCSLWIDL
jgi:hypothetical protein